MGQKQVGRIAYSHLIFSFVYNLLLLDINNIGAEGAKAIAEALKVNTSLTKINLWDNNIGDKGARELELAAVERDSDDDY